MKKLKQNMIISLVAISAIMYSCSNPTELEEDHQTSGYKGKLNSNAPTLSDGMLVFTDDNSYQDYLDFLKSVTNPSLTDQQIFDYAKDPRDIDEIVLDSIENSIGFTSLRAVNYAKFKAENAIGWDKPELVPDYYDSSDRIEQSVLNQYGEVKIGSFIKKVLSDNKIVFIRAEPKVIADHLLTQTRTLQVKYPDGKIPLEEIYELDVTSYYLIFDDLELTGPKVGPVDLIPNDYVINGVVQYANPCGGGGNMVKLQLFTLLKVTSWFNGYPGGTPMAAWHTIDFGNGVSKTVFAGTGPSMASFDETYIYSASGTYTIKISARFTQNGPVMASKSFNVTIKGTVCSDQKKTVSYTWHPTTDHSLKCKIKFWKRYHIIAGNYTRFGEAEAQHLVKEGNKWRVRKADRIFVGVKSLAYNEQCNPHPLGSSSTPYWIDNARFQDNVRSLGSGMGPVHIYDLTYSSIFAEFRIHIGGQVYTKFYTLEACN